MARDNGDNNEPRIWALRDRTRAAPQTLLARGMRRVPTEAEKRLWWHLHRLPLRGSHFRRQVRLGRYIVDFACHNARLVIEVDGGQHAENRADAVRTKFIETQGYRVLRFWNTDVLSNIEGVLEVIQAAVAINPVKRECHAKVPIDRMCPDFCDDSAADSSPPPCGEGAGVGVVSGGTALRQLPDPPPHPSPTRGEGVMQAQPPLDSARIVAGSSPTRREHKEPTL